MSEIEIAFSSKALRSSCESWSKAESMYGTNTATMLIRRIADLRAVDKVTNLIAGRPKESTGPCPRNFLLQLDQTSVLVFSANHLSNPILKTGCIDWSKVSRIKILRVEKNE